MSWLDVDDQKEDPRQAKRARAKRKEAAFVTKVDGMITSNLEELAARGFGSDNYVIERERREDYFDYDFHIWSAKRLKGFPVGSKYSVCLSFDDEGNPLRFGCRRDGPDYFVGTRGNWMLTVLDRIGGPDPEREIAASEFNQETLRRMLRWHYRVGP